MIDYSFLYYVSPEEYRFRLDGNDEDLNLEKVKADQKIFEKAMFSATLDDYITTIIKIYHKAYPNDTLLELAIIDYDFEKLKILPDKILRKEKDIQRVDFEYKPFDDEDPFEQYLHSVKITFLNKQTKLSKWIKDGLGDKEFAEDTQGALTVYTVNDSPILKIENDDDLMLTLFVDKNTYKSYY